MERKIENGMETGTVCCRDLGLGSRCVDYESGCFSTGFKFKDSMRDRALQYMWSL